MDFEADLDSALEVIPRKTHFHELPASGCPNCPDFEWQNKLGFVAANVYGVNVATDGMNEAGLSAAWLYLEATQYPSPKMGVFNSSKPVVTSICTYILGNFATVEEVKKGLEKVQLAGLNGQIAQQVLHVPAPEDGKDHTAPLHVSVHDRNGNNLVIEFLDGKVVFHDNPNGVLTNDPPLEEQLRLLNNHLSEAKGTINTGDLVPGGYGPTERFVRLSVLNKKVGEGYSAPSVHASYVEATEEQRAVSDALHLLNTVVRPPMGEATQWSIVRDHQRKMLYIRSTANQLLRRVSLDMVDWADPHARRLIPVSYGIWFFDSTVPLLDDHNTMRTKDLPPRSVVEAALSESQDPRVVFGKIETKSQFRKDSETEQFISASVQMQQADEMTSLSATWVFIVGSVAGGMLTALLSVGWKMIITDCLRRKSGYKQISDI
ncbi:Cysteine protease [Phytophthora megakarya]|uniref:Cysteine protease n=1 Tax=Phytophthora megakarya TaxID=4795 RepID=A0A225WNH0_9STRA|nr:Cysteine protease [Phytophthora megakarya]